MDNMESEAQNEFFNFRKTQKSIESIGLGAYVSANFNFSNFSGCNSASCPGWLRVSIYLWCWFSGGGAGGCLRGRAWEGSWI